MLVSVCWPAAPLKTLSTVPSSEAESSRFLLHPCGLDIIELDCLTAAILARSIRHAHCCYVELLVINHCYPFVIQGLHMQNKHSRGIHSIILPKETDAELFADRQALVKWRMDGDDTSGKRNLWRCYWSNGCGGCVPECGNLKILFRILQC